MQTGKWLAALVAVLVLGTAQAASDPPVVQGESVLTLRVDGELTIGPDGSVADYRIGTKLDPQVEALVKRAVPTWRFKPILVDGKPAVATSPMRITLAAEEFEQGYRVTVDNVVFRPNTKEQYEAELASRKLHPRVSVAGESPAPQVSISSKSLTPPKYPSGLQRSGVEGIVLLNLRLNRDGTVAEVFAAQSSLLNVKGREGLLDRARSMLERSAGDVAKRWTFQVEAENQAALSAEALTVRVPVSYTLGTSGEAMDGLAGKWRHEFRGPNLTAPWLAAEKTAKVGVSDLAANEMLAGVSPFELSDKSILGKAL
jgi:TonB family protein